MNQGKSYYSLLIFPIKGKAITKNELQEKKIDQFLSLRNGRDEGWSQRAPTQYQEKVMNILYFKCIKVKKRELVKIFITKWHLHPL